MADQKEPKLDPLEEKVLKAAQADQGTTKGMTEGITAKIIHNMVEQGVDFSDPNKAGEAFTKAVDAEVSVKNTRYAKYKMDENDLRHVMAQYWGDAKTALYKAYTAAEKEGKSIVAAIGGALNEKVLGPVAQSIAGENTQGVGESWMKKSDDLVNYVAGKLGVDKSKIDPRRLVQHVGEVMQMMLAYAGKT
ncbi:hypothetical protein KY328_05870, partial [Candidatus Woesearchaeota archaeon]|nr:hypothetical protein [Candidatus Woesearchaeota archaeon]